MHSSGDLFQRGSVHDEIHISHGHLESIGISDVANEVSYFRPITPLGHLGLFEFVSRIDDDAGRLVAFEDVPNEVLAERPCATGD
jgi:hypothetical protein